MQSAAARQNMMGGGFNPLSLLSGLGKIKDFVGGLLGGGDKAVEEKKEANRRACRDMSKPVEDGRNRFVDDVTKAGREAVDNVVNDAANVGKQFVTERAADAIFPVLKFLQLAKMVPGVEKTLVGALTKASLSEEEAKLLLDKPHMIYELIGEKGETFLDNVKESLFSLAENSVFVNYIPGMKGLIQQYKGDNKTKESSKKPEGEEDSVKAKGIKGMLLAGLAFLRPKKIISVWKAASTPKKFAMGIGGVVFVPVILKLALGAVKTVFNLMWKMGLAVLGFFGIKKFVGGKKAKADEDSNVVQMPKKSGGIWGFLKDKLHLGVHHATEMADKASGGMLSMTGVKDKVKNGISGQINKMAG